MKGHWSRVNLIKCETLLKDLYAISVLSFPNANKNKRPKGSYIVHLGIMCHLFYGSARAAIFLFTDKHKKHNLGKRRWHLAFCQVSLNSVQSGSQKCLSQSEAREAIFFFRSALNSQMWKRTLKSWFLSSFVEFRLGFQRESPKYFNQFRGRGCHIVFLIGQKKINLVEDVEILLPVKFRWIPFGVSDEKSKISQTIRGQVGNLVFLIDPKSTYLVEDVEILLPVKVSWIPFSGFRGKVKWLR